MNKLLPLGVYVHVPFCLAKCAYCDFLSFPCESGGFEGYVDGLCREVVGYAGEFTGYCVETLYFGGGTPTVLAAEELARLKSAVDGHFNVEAGAEVTIEANPETLDERKAAALVAAGFNRVSIGVQSWNDADLKRLGRVHSAQTAENAAAAARSAGFENISVDLMFALPNQTLTGWQKTVERTVAVAPRHISCYGLTVEDGTPLKKMLDAGFGMLNESIVLPGEDEYLEMYYFAKDAFKGAGYGHYEISSFAVPGFESRHNTKYWTGGEYLGVGRGAHSFVKGRRWGGGSDAVELTKRDLMSEFVFLGLRMTDGVSEDEFRRRFGVNINGVYGNQIEKFVKQGLLKRANGRVALTDAGIDVSNTIFITFL